MEENKSLNNKYQKIDIDEAPEEVVEPVKEKPKKEKKVKEPKVKKEKAPKEPKPPKEKKVKEPKPPKPPKEKKEKAPKEPKPPKEKKVKEPKPPKVKKEKKKKWEVEIVEDYSAEISEEIVVDEVAVEQEKPETIVTERRSEEIVLPAIKSVKQISGEKQKPEKKKKLWQKPLVKRKICDIMYLLNLGSFFFRTRNFRKRG